MAGVILTFFLTGLEREKGLRPFELVIAVLRKERKKMDNFFEICGGLVPDGNVVV